MATLTTTPTEGFAHCRDPRCAGTEQEVVDALRHVTEYSYVELGGSMPGVERSTYMYAFADEGTDSPCPVCGEPREVTAQARPHYTPISGHRQDGLLHVKQYNADSQPTGNDAIVAQLMAQVAALSAQVAGQAIPAQDTAPADEPESLAVTEPDDSEGEWADSVDVEAEADARAAEIKARRLAALQRARDVKAQKRAPQA